jgi:predicted dehydrogenase
MFGRTARSRRDERFDPRVDGPQDPPRARRLVAEVESSGRAFVLTHCYTGYPMVRQAREMVRSGALGAIRLVEAEFESGDPGVAREPEDPAQRHWRFRASSMGEAAILGEVGSHAHNIAEYVTGRSSSGSRSDASSGGSTSRSRRPRSAPGA